MNKCEFWFKIYYKKAMADSAINTSKAISKCVSEMSPPFSTVIASAISKAGADHIEELKKRYIAGPCCGGVVVENGRLTDRVL